MRQAIQWVLLAVLLCASAQAQAAAPSDPIRLDTLKSVSDISDYIRRSAPDAIQFSVQNSRETPAVFLLQRAHPSDIIGYLSFAERAAPLRIFGSNGSEFAANPLRGDFVHLRIPPRRVVTFRILPSEMGGYWLWSPPAYQQFLERRAAFRNFALLAIFFALAVAAVRVWQKRSRRGVGALGLAVAFITILLLVWKPYWLGFAALASSASADYLWPQYLFFWSMVVVIIACGALVHITLSPPTLRQRRYWGFTIIFCDALFMAMLALIGAVAHGVLRIGPLTNSLVELSLVIMIGALITAPLTLSGSAEDVD